MALTVQKFGGSSVKDRDRIFNVARIVANTHNAGNDVVVVVSAQGDTTDDLIAKAAEITHNPSAREMDMLLAAGEEISISLLAMALNELGCHATSLTGWQAGFRTDRAYTKARITRMETERISSELERNRVVVVAGFQGLNKLDDITTLGRGGSDTSAVAIAAALHADRCQIFTDVEGVYTADPRKVRNTRKLDEITFDEMLELASLGAQVLNNRSVELAKKYNVELYALSCDTSPYCNRSRCHLATHWLSLLSCPHGVVFEGKQLPDGNLLHLFPLLLLPGFLGGENVICPFQRHV